MKPRKVVVGSWNGIWCYRLHSQIKPAENRHAGRSLSGVDSLERAARLFLRFVRGEWRGVTHPVSPYRGPLWWDVFCCEATPGRLSCASSYSHSLLPFRCTCQVNLVSLWRNSIHSRLERFFPILNFGWRTTFLKESMAGICSFDRWSMIPQDLSVLQKATETQTSCTNFLSELVLFFLQPSWLIFHQKQNLEWRGLTACFLLSQG